MSKKPNLPLEPDRSLATLGLNVARAGRIIGAVQMEVGMSQTVEQIEAQALGLSPEDRVRLADRLIASVFEDEAIESAWSAEVERRIADIEAGRAELIPASQAIARARDAIK